MEEISQKIVNDLQPLFSGFPTETGEISLDSSSHKLKTASQDRTRNVFDTLYNTVDRYKKRFTALNEEVRLSMHLCMLACAMVLWCGGVVVMLFHIVCIAWLLANCKINLLKKICG